MSVVELLKQAEKLVLANWRIRISNEVDISKTMVLKMNMKIRNEQGVKYFRFRNYLLEQKKLGIKSVAGDETLVIKQAVN